MKRIATLAVAACLVAATPANAGGGHHDAGAALLGGLAAGAIIGGLAAPGFYGYGYGYRGPYWGPPAPPPPLYRPPPVVYGSYGYPTVHHTARHRPCREFQQEIWVDGRLRPAYGRACLQSDGSWRIVD